MGKVVGRFRHWRQRFNKNARMQFRRNVKLRKVSYKKGDEVPENLLGLRKLRRWWDAGIIELLNTSKSPKKEQTETPSVSEQTDDQSSPEPESDETSHQLAEDQVLTPATKPEKIEASYTHVGGGWYEVLAGDIKERVKGKATAQKRVEELESSSGQTLHISDPIP